MWAISLAITAAESGRRVYFSTLAGLVESLAQAKAAGQLARRLRVLTHPALMVVDEIGCAPRGAKKPCGVRDPPGAVAAAP
ncbi:MAG: ATP-binding protein [Spirochaetaceae bacterium]|nr:ATP-binding protein [Spirochaetaceae bacterium]